MEEKSHSSYKREDASAEKQIEGATQKITNFFPILRTEGRAKMCASKSDDSKQKEMVKKRGKESMNLRSKRMEKQNEKSSSEATASSQTKDKIRNISVASALKTPLSQVLRRSMEVSEKKEALGKSNQSRSSENSGKTTDVSQPPKKNHSDTEGGRMLRQKSSFSEKPLRSNTAFKKKTELNQASGSEKTKSSSSESVKNRTTHKIATAALDTLLEEARTDSAANMNAKPRKNTRKRHFRGSTYGLYLTPARKRKKKMKSSPDESKDDECSVTSTENNSFLDSEDANSHVSEDFFTPSEKSLIDEEHCSETQNSSKLSNAEQNTEQKPEKSAVDFVPEPEKTAPVSEVCEAPEPEPKFETIIPADYEENTQNVTDLFQDLEEMQWEPDKKENAEVDNASDSQTIKAPQYDDISSESLSSALHFSFKKDSPKQPDEEVIESVADTLEKCEESVVDITAVVDTNNNDDGATKLDENTDMLPEASETTMSVPDTSSEILNVKHDSDVTSEVSKNDDDLNFTASDISEIKEGLNEVSVDAPASKDDSNCAFSDAPESKDLDLGASEITENKETNNDSDILDDKDSFNIDSLAEFDESKENSNLEQSDMIESQDDSKLVACDDALERTESKSSPGFNLFTDVNKEVSDSPVFSNENRQNFNSIINENKQEFNSLFSNENNFGSNSLLFSTLNKQDSTCLAFSNENKRETNSLVFPNESKQNTNLFFSNENKLKSNSLIFSNENKQGTNSLVFSNKNKQETSSLVFSNENKQKSDSPVFSSENKLESSLLFPNNNIPASNSLTFSNENRQYSTSVPFSNENKQDSNSLVFSKSNQNRQEFNSLTFSNENKQESNSLVFSNQSRQEFNSLTFTNENRQFSHSSSLPSENKQESNCFAFPNENKPRPTLAFSGEKKQDFNSFTFTNENKQDSNSLSFINESKQDSNLLLFTNENNNDSVSFAFPNENQNESGPVSFTNANKHDSNTLSFTTENKQVSNFLSFTNETNENNDSNSLLCSNENKHDSEPSEFGGESKHDSVALTLPAKECSILKTALENKESENNFRNSMEIDNSEKQDDGDVDAESTIATCVKSRQRIKRRFTDDIVDTDLGILSAAAMASVKKALKQDSPKESCGSLPQSVVTHNEAKKGSSTAKIECVYNCKQTPIKTCDCEGDSYQAKIDKSEEGAFCQAVDSLDDKLLGCSNPVVTSRLVRPSVKIPFIIMCEMHLWRLNHHHACPYCGLFCSQGSFMQCRNGNTVHLYHEQCQNKEEGHAQFCLHCGSTETLKRVHLELHMTSPPSFFLSQSSNVSVPDVSKARISFSESSDLYKKDDEEPTPTYKIDDSGKILSSAGMPNGANKEELEKLIGVLSDEKVRSCNFASDEFYEMAAAGNVIKVLYMLAKGFEPNAKFPNHDSDTALHAAAAEGHITVVHLLVQAGAVNDTLNERMYTPLMLAVENGHKEVVHYLVKEGALTDFKGENGMSSLHLAAKSGNLDVLKILMSSRDIDIDGQDDGGWTPIVWASEHDHLTVVRYLLKRGANPNIRDNEGNIGLHWSAFSGSVEISYLYLEYGCDINAINELGDTPLHIAARQDSFPCVTLFLSRAADVQILNKANKVPAECCIDKNSDTYLSLSLNMLLKKITGKYQHKAEKIKHRDISRGKEQLAIQCVNAVDDEMPPLDFLYVTENCETMPIKIDRTITSLQSCHCEDDCSTSSCNCASISYQCWYDKEGLLLPEFNLLDPPMLFECNRACSCWSLNCHNRVLQNGITCRLQLIRTKGKGWGVRSLKDIPKGAFICEYVGELISDSAADKRSDDSYLFDLDNRDGETYCLDARYYGNISRFINHLCEPNLVPVKIYVDHQDLNFPRIAFFSSRDIKQYEELGFDYGEKFWAIKYKYFTCECGTPKCKYSKESIHITLANYYRRLKEEQMEEAAQQPEPLLVVE